MRQIDRSFWRGCRVFVTGHMGFKGAWLTSLLARLGAESEGYGDDDRAPLLYRELKISGHRHRRARLEDLATLKETLADSGADILFHLAAQPIVLNSFRDPIGTFRDNVMGTAHVLEAARYAPSLKAVVVATSDKVYQNMERTAGYSEADRLGGSDPYSASKAAAEIVTNAMASSFFAGKGMAKVATARAGNVIGGGDWADHRLLPDAARALGAGRALTVRNPTSTRPWQHVLDPLCGYLLLAQAMAKRSDFGIRAVNFGPQAGDAIAVSEVADKFVAAWGGEARWEPDEHHVVVGKEAGLLAVDSSLAQRELGWRPHWRVDEAIARTAAWYRDYYDGRSAGDLVERDVDAFLDA